MILWVSYNLLCKNCIFQMNDQEKSIPKYNWELPPAKYQNLLLLHEVRRSTTITYPWYKTTFKIHEPKGYVKTSWRKALECDKLQKLSSKLLKDIPNSYLSHLYQDHTPYHYSHFGNCHLLLKVYQLAQIHCEVLMKDIKRAHFSMRGFDKFRAKRLTCHFLLKPNGGS